MKIENTFDMYASAALQALISKSPFLDKEGEHGKQLDDTQMHQFKIDISRSALEYASVMCSQRDEFFGQVIASMSVNSTDAELVR